MMQEKATSAEHIFAARNSSPCMTFLPAAYIVKTMFAGGFF